MGLLVPAGGADVLLTLLLANWGLVRVGLYRADHAPAIADNVGTYQAIESNFAGYARQVATGWSLVTVNPLGVASTRANILTWTRSAAGAAQAVYGYFVVNAGNELLWAQRDTSAPVAINKKGSTYRLYPSFALWGAEMP